MSRRALLVGINTYDHLPGLGWCRDDALAMYDVLRHHENGEPNFACHLLLDIAPGEEPKESDRAQITFDATFNGLHRALEDLFAFDDTVLFYFSGHGYASSRGRCLATQDSTISVPGVLMNDVLKMANDSPARNVLLIIDSCFSGAIGEMVPTPETAAAWEIPDVFLRDGVTILAAARPDEKAVEIGGHGVFTRLVLDALKGGGADIRGRVSAASIYAYVEQALGPWQQRPVYKSNASSMPPIRYCQPEITDEELRLLPKYFPTVGAKFKLDRTFEVTDEQSIPAHVQIFQTFKRYQVARLLRPSFPHDRDLYFVAIRGNEVELTPLGQFYWQLAKDHRLTDARSFAAQRSFTQMDAESLARLFHETYERLAPHFNYETRKATRVPWEQVPENNKRLMIAVATEVLAALAAEEGSSHSSSAE